MATVKSSVHGGLEIVSEVPPGCRFERQGSVYVNSTMESAHVRIGGDLTVLGGITGVRGLKVIAGGRIVARFISDAEVQAGGEIVIEGDVVGSKLTTRSAVTMPAGRFAGGEAVALGWIMVGEAGDENSVRTVLAAGEDPALESLVSEKEAEIKVVEGKAGRISEVLAEAMDREKEMTHNERQEATVLMARQNEMERTIKRIRGEIEEIRKRSQASAKPCILVMGRIHPGTMFRLAGKTVQTRKPMNGPVCVAKPEEGPICATLIRLKVLIDTVDIA